MPKFPVPPSLTFLANEISRGITLTKSWPKTSPMRAVSNTSPISNLAAIGRLRLLQSQFSEIWIPAAVSQELGAHPDPVALAAIRGAMGEAWIKQAPMPASRLADVLSLHLHGGEAETIALAADLKAEIVIVDEQEGRWLSRSCSSTMTSTTSSHFIRLVDGHGAQVLGRWDAGDSPEAGGRGTPAKVGRGGLQAQGKGSRGGKAEA